MGCFAADIFQLITKHIKIWLFSTRLGTRHQIQKLKGFSLTFLYSKNLKFYFILFIYFLVIVDYNRILTCTQ